VNAEQHQKVTASHLKRPAYLYIRQSTLRQVLQNTESTLRQYALRERAVALGWPLERVVVIDTDQGQTGATSEREGFQKLVAAVGLAEVGIVLGLEVSRLARNNADWQRLLEICALTDTLILDEDGLYNPSLFNDRLLLGLKGTLSEAELHVLRARLRGGIMNKAARGEFRIRLPVGFVYTPDHRVVLDPDRQVQEALRVFFTTFRRVGSAQGTVRNFCEQGLLMPHRLHNGAHKGELVWVPLGQNLAVETLRNPRYAGAYAYGRHQSVRIRNGRRWPSPVAREQWHALILDAHPGYISWEEYEDNQRRLRENAQAQGRDRAQGPPREGLALLQGLVVCGRCGERMSVRYSKRGELLRPIYVCQRQHHDYAGPLCQQVPGVGVDQAMSELLLEAVTPLALEVALAVQQELDSRAEEADRLRRGQVERARYEAELAQRRYLHVDPANRLVADSLEADWNQKLRALHEAQEDYERRRQADSWLLDEQRRQQILALATDFPRLWHDPQTSPRERKRMVRLLLEDVTLLKKEQINVHVRFKGGATRTLVLPIPLKAWQLTQADPELVAEVDRLLDQHTDGQIATILNQRGLKPKKAEGFTSRIVRALRRSYGLTNRFSRLRQAGLLTGAELASEFGVCGATVQEWYRAGRLQAHAFNDHGGRLYERPADSPSKWLWQRNRGRSQLLSAEQMEVQSVG